MFIQGIIRSSTRTHTTKTRPIVTTEVLAKTALYKDVGVALIAHLMYSALLRISEVIVLKWTDCIPEDNSLAIHIRKAKNDQLSKGRTTYVPFDDGSSIKNLWTQWDKINFNSKFLFPSFASDDRHMPRSSAAKRLKKMFKAIGHPDLSSHSFRAGAATNEAARGVPIHELQRRGRWRSLKGMDPYVRDSLKAQGGHTLI